MDETLQPGIRFHGIELRHLQFELCGEVPARLPFSPSVKMQGRLSEDKSHLEFHFTMDMFGGLIPKEKPPITCEFTLVGRFSVGSNPNMTLEEFAKNHAPGLLMPYVRELISNLTSRTALPHLNLAPVNVLAWVNSGRATFEWGALPKSQQEVG